MTFHTSRIRAQFPILKVRVQSTSGKQHPLRYFDHAASTHAPKPVLDAVMEAATTSYANVHRGNHHLSRVSTDLFEAARETLLGFVGGDAMADTVLFSQNTSTALAAAAHVMRSVPGGTVITHLEHHSNDLPHRQAGRVHRVDPGGDLSTLPDRIEAVLQKHKCKLVAVTAASNVTGERPDVHAIAKVAHDHGAKILVDAAQLAGHGPVDAKSPDRSDHLDFVAAAGHKTYAPFGSAILYGPRDLLDRASPTLPAGGTVLFVGRDEAHFAVSPDRHEGGTPNILGAVAFAAAARWLQGIGFDDIVDHEAKLFQRLRRGLAGVEGLTTYHVGGAPARVGVVPFLMDGWDYAQLASALNDGWGIATRDGCFCAHPLMVDLLQIPVKELPGVKQRLLEGSHDVPGLVRASLGIYNHEDDVDTLVAALGVLAARPRASKSSQKKLAKPVEIPAIGGRRTR